MEDTLLLQAAGLAIRTFFVQGLDSLHLSCMNMITQVWLLFRLIRTLSLSHYSSCIGNFRELINLFLQKQALFCCFQPAYVSQTLANWADNGGFFVS